MNDDVRGIPGQAAAQLKIRGNNLLKITETTDGVWAFHDPADGPGQSKYVVYRYNSGNFKCDICRVFSTNGDTDWEAFCEHIAQIKTIIKEGRNV